MRSLDQAKDAAAAAPTPAEKPGPALSAALGTIWRGALVAALVRGGELGARYFAQVVLARWSGPAGYGRYSYALTIAQMLAVPASLGLDSAAIRFAPEYVAQKDWGRLRGLVSRSRRVTAAGGAMLAMAGGGALVWARPPALDSRSALACAILVPAIGFLTLEREICRALYRVARSYLVSALQPLLLVVLAREIFRYAGRLSGFAAVLAAGTSLFAAAGAQAALSESALASEAVSSPALDATRTWLSVSLPMLAINCAQFLAAWAGVLVLGFFRSSREVGVYSAASGTASLVGVPLIAANVLGAPVISNLFARGERQTLEQTLQTVTAFLWGAGGLIALALAVWGRPLLGLFGPEFMAGRAALLILAAGQTVNVATGPVGYLLTLTGGHRLTAWVSVATAAVHVLGSFLLVPRFGAIGAAVAAAGTAALWNGWVYALAVRRLGIHTISPKAAARLIPGCVARIRQLAGR